MKKKILFNLSLIYIIKLKKQKNILPKNKHKRKLKNKPKLSIKQKKRQKLKQMKLIKRKCKRGRS
jgi:hypothetical protein